MSTLFRQAYISMTIFRTQLCPMKSFVISRYGLSSKLISEAAMQIKQAETVREFKPLRSLLWAKNKTKISSKNQRFIYHRYRIEQENSLMRKINCVLTNQNRRWNNPMGFPLKWRQRLKIWNFSDKINWMWLANCSSLILWIRRVSYTVSVKDLKVRWN